MFYYINILQILNFDIRYLYIYKFWVLFKGTYVLEVEIKMNQSSYDILSGMMEELQNEYKLLQIKIDDCLFQIKEADINDLQQQLDKLYYEKKIIASKIEKLESVILNEQEINVDSDEVKRNLSILNMQEQDRQRIARDLHDTSLQNLAHLVHKIELSSLFIDQDPIRAKLELAVISKNLKSVIDEVRNIIFDLRPMSFDDLGLKSAFEQLVQKAKVDYSLDIDTDIDYVSAEDNLVLATIFRVVQECFTNIVKHSEAKKIIFNCKMKDDFCIIDIHDNGKGFTKSEVEDKQDKNKHFGISVMRERICLLGGEIKIDSEKERGTHIHIEIPLSVS